MSNNSNKQNAVSAMMHLILIIIYINSLYYKELIIRLRKIFIQKQSSCIKSHTKQYSLFFYTSFPHFIHSPAGTIVRLLAACRTCEFLPKKGAKIPDSGAVCGQGRLGKR
jgi:hypothetical protein